MFQFLPKHFHFTHLTWVHLFLYLYHAVDAQSSMEPVPTYMSHNKWEPSFVITVLVVIFALLFMGIVSIYIRSCVESRIIMTQTNSMAGGPKCSCSQGINKELLNTFPVLFYSTIKDLKIGKGALECAVCLTDFKDNDTLRLLPKCNHVFHPQCIDSWLASRVTCPVCRTNLSQDSCQVAITVPTLLTTDQRGVENSGTHGSDENEIEPNPNANPNPHSNPLVHNLNEGDGNVDDSGGASKFKLLRSNSTGHSLVESGKCVERYTLRLPEDVRRCILVNHGRRIQRSASYHNNNYMVKGLFWSDIEGKGNNGEGRVERWVLCAPPFVARHG